LCQSERGTTSGQMKNPQRRDFVSPRAGVNPAPTKTKAKNPHPSQTTLRMGHPKKRLTCVRRGPTLVGPYKGKDAAETAALRRRKSAARKRRKGVGGDEPGPYEDKGEKSPPFANNAQDGAPEKTPDMRQARADPSRPLQRQRRRRTMPRRRGALRARNVSAIMNRFACLRRAEFEFARTEWTRKN